MGFEEDRSANLRERGLMPPGGLGRRDRRGDRGSTRAGELRALRRLQPRREMHHHGVSGQNARIWDASLAIQFGRNLL